MSELALYGGTQIHPTGWPAWPQNSPLEEGSILSVLRSGQWWKNSLGKSSRMSEGGETPSSEVANSRQPLPIITIASSGSVM